MTEGISKKAPCPCGSGRNFGDCCGLLVSLGVDKTGIPTFAFCKSIAYKGKVGREREQFCIENYTKKKKTLLLIKESIKSLESEIEQSVTCQKGCSYCCSLFIEATIQECETIVYKLYQKPEVLISFLQNYPKWREQIRSNGDLIKGRDRFCNANITTQMLKVFCRNLPKKYKNILPKISLVHSCPQIYVQYTTIVPTHVHHTLQLLLMNGVKPTARTKRK